MAFCGGDCLSNVLCCPVFPTKITSVSLWYLTNFWTSIKACKKGKIPSNISWQILRHALFGIINNYTMMLQIMWIYIKQWYIIIIPLRCFHQEIWLYEYFNIYLTNMYDFLLCNIEICKYVHFDGCFKYLYLPQWRSRLEASRRLGVSNPSSDRPKS